MSDSQIANSKDPDQTAPGSNLIWVCTVYESIFHVVTGVPNFSAFTIPLTSYAKNDTQTKKIMSEKSLII